VEEAFKESRSEIATQRFSNTEGSKSNSGCYIFDVHRAVYRNIISTVKATRCTNVSNLFYIGMKLFLQ
jgi:hypothetical protein